MTTPTVLFVCVHNAGRSQMAAGFAREIGGGAVRVLSGGSEPGDAINPVAVAAMAEEGIDISAAVPSILDVDDVRAADVVITMGCGDACPVFPGKRYEDWELTDPAGLGIDEVRPIRDQIRQRVAGLLAEIGVPPVHGAEVRREEVDLEIEQALDDLIHFRGDVEVLRQALWNYPWQGSRPVRLGLEECEKAAEMALDPSTRGLVVRWARFLIGRRDVVIDPKNLHLILEFLEDVSFSETQFELDEHVLGTFALRLGLAMGSIWQQPEPPLFSETLRSFAVEIETQRRQGSQPR